MQEYVRIESFSGEPMKLEQLDVQYVTDEAGEKRAVILPIEQFYELLEDLEDLAAIAERRDESTISHEQLRDELKRNGTLPS
jgi:hypothetical protein